MKKIDSQALETLTRALGLSGAGSPATELTDGVVDQSLAINELVRRGRTQAATEGIYTATMECNNTDAETQTAVIKPYTVGALGIAPYPEIMPRGFDIWLLYASGVQVSGASTINVALRVLFPATQQGFGVDEAAAIAVADADMVVARWNASAATSGSFLLGDNKPTHFINLRLPRSEEIALQMSCTSSVTTVIRLFLVLGVFPSALGQDGVV